MLINNVSITSFNAKLLKKDIQTAEIIVYEDWLRKALSPIVIEKEEKYKKINTEYLVKGSTDSEALINISNLIKSAEECIIKFSNIDFYYNCFIVDKSHTRIKEGIYRLKMEFKSSYAYKDELVEIISNVTSKAITALGNTEMPVILEITPSINLIDLTINGLGDEFILKNLTTGNTVIINSEEGTVLENGVNKFIDFEGWDFPVLNPGNNIITLSSENCIINLRYKPRWI